MSIDLTPKQYAEVRKMTSLIWLVGVLVGFIIGTTSGVMVTVWRLGACTSHW